MKFYMAPMEGITGYIYRNAYHKYFLPADKYFTPFLSPAQNGELRTRDINDILPENNREIPLIPQLLSNRAEAFLKAAETLRQYGYQEVNLNLGCPSGTVAAKGKGAGFLSFPQELDRFLEKICRGLETIGMELSVKTRVGRKDKEEFGPLMEIYARYPIKELIIHPRVQKDFYKNSPDRECFALGMKKSPCPVCYNGDIVSLDSLNEIRRQFPGLDRVMIGRGLLAYPMLLEQLAEERGSRDEKADRKRLRAFHEEVYQGYLEIMSGDRNVLFKMKEMWSYLIQSFQEGTAYMKMIGKAKSRGEYEAAVSAVFCDLDLR